MLLALAAAVCFFLAMLVALNAFDGNEQALQEGGLLALALSFVAP